ncbi:A/G-specific adenine glycosylase [Reinekea blandensis]|uniref:Adenine DNA glycosylase n=1 Tax=Reinekea blandensis MED297 TaxID=314283 RepID=A4BBE8_9GAMM|nr:A/G-specific adenine glycosylase [Reinekea blandensis]EAR10761.1 A/G-specific adenine glycosylase [Reinekea sp. MED297] [Reinekea blandensis MED297]
MHCSVTWFRNAVLAWYDRHGRKDLPWQTGKTAYRVWLSEVMLQQTQVTTVIPYFQAFTERFPDVAALAEADIDEVLHLWTGLGYYARARNLHKAAKAVMDSFGGEFPADPEALETLPGVGRSTAAAIVSSVFDRRAAILDGNVKRVLSRFFALEEWPGSTAAQKQLWAWSEALTPQTRVADYNQVMMDLGALVCKRSRPACAECPLSEECLAHRHDLTSELPKSKPKKAKPVRTCFMVLQQSPEGQVLLQQRPASGIWGGLYSFPEFSDEGALEHYLDSIAIEKQEHWTPFRHTFSHYHLDIAPIVVHQQTAVPGVAESGHLWFNPHLLDDAEQAIGLPAPVKQLLIKLASSM